MIIEVERQDLIPGKVFQADTGFIQQILSAEDFQDILNRFTPGSPTYNESLSDQQFWLLYDNGLLTEKIAPLKNEIPSGTIPYFVIDLVIPVSERNARIEAGLNKYPDIDTIIQRIAEFKMKFPEYSNIEYMSQSEIDAINLDIVSRNISEIALYTGQTKMEVNEQIKDIENFQQLQEVTDIIADNTPIENGQIITVDPGIIENVINNVQEKKQDEINREKVKQIEEPVKNKSNSFLDQIVNFIYQLIYK